MNEFEKKDLKTNTKDKAKRLAGKSKNFTEEFKAFILRGNVVDMAIGVIIGTAFSGLITAFTTDFINPLINGIGGVNVGGKLKIYGGEYILWGDFVTSVINFIIMAFVLFLMLRFINRVMSIGKKKNVEEPVVPSMSKEEELLCQILEEIKKK